ncbi:MAG: hypothetical protein KIS92_00340 [Planctomycetota bacterium]|nr:hypothetical protein [Planctomycetota bacterium]
MLKIVLGSMLMMLAVGLSPRAFAANADAGKQIDDHTWQGRVSIEQDVPRISVNNKILKLVLSDKADQNAKDTFKDPSKFKVKGHGFMKATVTGALQKDKEGSEFLLVDTIKLEAPPENPKKPADKKKKKNG